MLEATKRVYKLVGLGDLISLDEEYSVTSKGVWCHVLDLEKIKKLRTKYGNANYMPNPCLTIRSSQEKKNFCLLMINKDSEMNSEWMQAVKFLSTQGIQIKSVVEDTLSSLEKLRVFKEAKFVIAYDCQSLYTQSCLCGSGTPFFIRKPCTQTIDFLHQANLKECYTTTSLVTTISDILFNAEKFTELVDLTIENMKAYHTWIDNIVETQQDRIDPLVFFEGVIFRPWTCFLQSSDLEVLKTKTFHSSLVFCKNIYLSRELSLRLPEELESISGRIVKTQVAEVAFSFDDWKEQKGIVIVCSNKMFAVDMNTMSGEVTTEIPSNYLIFYQKITQEEFRRNIENRVMFLCRKTGKTLNYPGSVLEDITPDNVREVVTELLVSKILDYYSDLINRDLAYLSR